MAISRNQFAPKYPQQWTTDHNKYTYGVHYYATDVMVYEDTVVLLGERTRAKDTKKWRERSGELKAPGPLGQDGLLFSQARASFGFTSRSVRSCSRPVLHSVRPLSAMLWLLVILGCLSGAVRAQRCEPIKVPLCAHLGYNLTVMPNFLGHRDQEEAEREVVGMEPSLRVPPPRYPFRLELCPDIVAEDDTTPQRIKGNPRNFMRR
ncbi:hypothetical protein AAG570_002393 [Ranatra chinensis]|uniref:FZ domain-containing protein n=1 Tax=Ranatra chinensis TaxID=642074 RepID=A0ABD0YLJ0_9HEMI